MDRLTKRLTFDRDPDRDNRIRPVFPDVLFEQLTRDPHILEVGPGTGQATQALVARGARVTAIEIGPRLADFIRARFPAEAVKVLNGEFERIELPEHRWHAVFSANAYHWITESERIARPAALLEPGALFATMDFVQIVSPSDQGFFDRVTPIYDRFGQGRSPSHPRLPTFEEAQPVVLPQLEASAAFSPPSVTRVRADYTLSSNEYRDLLNTYSNMQAMNERKREALIDELIAVTGSEFGGQVTIPMAAVLIMANRV